MRAKGGRKSSPKQLSGRAWKEFLALLTRMAPGSSEEAIHELMPESVAPLAASLTGAPETSGYVQHPLSMHESTSKAVARNSAAFLLKNGSSELLRSSLKVNVDQCSIAGFIYKTGHPP